MCSLLREFWCGIKIGLKYGLICILMACGAGWVAINASRGWCAYRVENHRVQWCLSLRLPGREPFFNHYSNAIEKEWTVLARYRVSPWFDNGPELVEIDNPLPK